MSALAAALAQVLPPPPPPVFAAGEPLPERPARAERFTAPTANPVDRTIDPSASAAGRTPASFSSAAGWTAAPSSAPLERTATPLASPAEQPAATSTGRRARKLWELDDKLHCPLIGTCLPMEQLRRIARRFDFKADLQDNYQLHVEAVHRSLHRNDFSEAVQQYLDRTHASVIRRFKSIRGDAQVRDQWRACLERGEVAGPMWAALSHRDAERETHQAVYFDVHMLSHQVGAGQAADLRRLTFLERENQTLRAQWEAERHRNQKQTEEDRERITALLALRDALAPRVRLVAQLQQELAAHERGEALRELQDRFREAERLNERLLDQVQRLAPLEEALVTARAEQNRLAREVERLAREREVLESMLQPPACPRCACRDCPGPDAGCGGEHGDAPTRPRCVLCVGGRPTLVAQYRTLAERAGVRLLHHDGGREEAISRLPELIASADAVLCPTDCVSHTAYYQVKRQCRQAGTPCLFYQGTGVSSFALALSRLATGERSLSGGLALNS